MKKVTFVTMLTAILLGTLTVSCVAEQGSWQERSGRSEQGSWHGGIRDRINEANRRIDRGIERGSLTRHEARRLNEELNDILDKISRMKDDGHLDERERERINNDLDRLDNDINREKTSLIAATTDRKLSISCSRVTAEVARATASRSLLFHF
jgi:polyhydroxyalkanoate synthesis regulator phasin